MIGYKKGTVVQITNKPENISGVSQATIGTMKNGVYLCTLDMHGGLDVYMIGFGENIFEKVFSVDGVQNARIVEIAIQNKVLLARLDDGGLASIDENTGAATIVDENVARLTNNGVYYATAYGKYYVVDGGIAPLMENESLDIYEISSVFESFEGDAVVYLDDGVAKLRVKGEDAVELSGLVVLGYAKAGNRHYALVDNGTEKLMYRVSGGQLVNPIQADEIGVVHLDRDRLDGALIYSCGNILPHFEDMPVLKSFSGWKSWHPEWSGYGKTGHVVEACPNDTYWKLLPKHVVERSIETFLYYVYGGSIHIIDADGNEVQTTNLDGVDLLNEIYYGDWGDKLNLGDTVGNVLPGGAHGFFVSYAESTKTEIASTELKNYYK